MNLIEVDRALRQLRLGGMASAVEARVREAQTEKLPHLDLIARLITDELTIRADRLLDRRFKAAGFRDSEKTLDGFDFDFNKKMKPATGLRPRGRPLRDQTRGRSLPRASRHR